MELRRSSERRDIIADYSTAVPGSIPFKSMHMSPAPSKMVRMTITKITIGGGVPDLDFDDDKATVNLSHVRKDDKSDVYLVFAVDKPGAATDKDVEYVAQTKVVPNTKECDATLLEDVVEIDVPSTLALPLRVRVLLLDSDPNGRDDVIGSALVPLDQSSGTVGPQAVRLGALARFHSQAKTTLTFDYTIAPLEMTGAAGYDERRGVERPTSRGLLHSSFLPKAMVRIEWYGIRIAGRLPDLDAKIGSGTSDPFLQFVVVGPDTDFAVVSAVSMNEEQISLSMVKLDVPAVLLQAPMRLRVLLWDKDLMKENDYFGHCDFKIDATAQMHGSVAATPIRFGRRASELIILDEMTHPTLSFEWKLVPLGVVEGIRRNGRARIKY